jgi:protoheme IX farnesyltransferase
MMPDMTRDKTTRAPGPIRDLLTLVKVRITVATTLTSGAGYILATGNLEAGIWIPLLGTFLLACGASALNHCQEVEIDARMKRTMNRPLPAGRMAVSTAFFIAGLLILLGLAVLATNERNSLQLVGLGALAVAWYNVVYVYLKRLTAFAAVPGALIGALPPTIGWVAGNGMLGHPLILLVAGFFFVWQVPHFWLLLLIQGEQYEAAGLPSLTARFAPEQLHRITFMWVLATAAAGIFLPAIASRLVPWYLAAAMVVASVWLAMKAFVLLRPPAPTDRRTPFLQAFIRINVYALLIIVCLSLAALTSDTTGLLP